MQGKGLTAPTCRPSPEEGQSGEPDGTGGYISTPLQGKSFRKAVSAVMDDLGIDDKIIEKINLIDMAAKGCIINVW